ncbi:signal peptidase I [Tessaracoccus oleiagri]|uniref:Signal peptidase I n=1 Tax=Tessaracoccus oleiagri TaxID=686624 RepID=A0A1G9KN69_9ACTN|nr:signal peptidase I [Tessaracoccus oleiagri]SDL51208.1 signal peptidase, endoplasmic reticulum-type [Tessaracoccus oleiagri]
MLRLRQRPDTEGAAPARLLVNATSALLLWTSIFAALVLVVVPFVTGSTTYSVLTNSMAPAYPPGTFLVVRPQPFDELAIGDVVTYQIESGKPDVITHRVTGFAAGQDGSRLLVLKGDNNDVADPPVREVQVRGKLLYAVPYAGFVANALGRQDRGLILKLVAVGLIVYGAGSVVAGVRARRRDKGRR